MPGSLDEAEGESLGHPGSVQIENSTRAMLFWRSFESQIEVRQTRGAVAPIDRETSIDVTLSLLPQLRND